MATIIFLLTLLTIIFFFLHRRKASSPTRLPPRPPGLPLLGNLHQLGSLPHRSLNSLSKKYGPLILLQLGVTAPTVVVSSAEIAEQVMKAQDLIFASRPPSSLANHLLYNSTDVAFSPYSDYWRMIKKICVVHLLSSKCVQSYKSVREEEVALLIADIRAASVAAEAVNLSKRLVVLTNDILCRVALGRKYSGETKFGEMLEEFTKLLGCFPVADFVPWLGWIDVLTGLNARVRRNSKELDELLEQILEERLHRKRSKTIGADEEVLDLVDVLLSVKDQHEGNDAAIPLQKEHIKAVILDMFAGGTDTTFTVLEWAMAELIHHPTCMQDVQKEIRDVVGSKEFVEEEDIDRLTYLKAIIKETLRFHVPVALLVPRVATENTLLQGYGIPAGTRIIINAWAIARDPNYWDRPEEFWPERFIDCNVEFKGQDFQFTPFGAGRRACPGIGFAIATIECALANLLHHFDWEVPKEMRDEALDMSELRGITIHKKSPLLLTAKLHYVELA
ncbi:cytochrome P450 71A1-like [Dendrobium catenatum]|uniref:Cytochrome P450 71A1 n=1 Tax=Dendrobium catenatum TaxID=906689 RepID=A0A2I0VZL4_9ASPA|nr:cytochrome P450 71A1-like [Dendrobium catenatum]PKU68847.1 Cytochrome P450 71A1 [Dendrobium catenatum]